VTPPGLDVDELRRMVGAALAEDLGTAGDVTTDAVIAADARGVGRLIARSPLVVAGLPVAREVFRALDPTLLFEAHHRDGEQVPASELLATVAGPARPILRGERTALNFLMRMSGIATATRAAVEEIEGTGARILDTRKTAPGLRLLDKYAVATGGGCNHRMGLWDAAMIKDTHVAVAGSVGTAVRMALAAGIRTEAVTAEVRTAAELEEAIAAGAGRALLDNMGASALRECVRIGKGRIVLEVSGGLRPGGLRAAAETGVDFLSLGCLTHSVAAADVAMEMEGLR
jgi:nicotinate-nucleotide pyrophosphorylase (carboxylating)